MIVEPVAANVGVIAAGARLPRAPPRDVTGRDGALLIFDEVITGFRVGRGGAQARFGVTPDLTTLGKIIGGGMPIGAYGGGADLMALVAPAGPVYQAGTLSGHPLSMAAGIATLDALDAGPRTTRLEATGARLAAGLRAAAADAGRTGRDRPGRVAADGLLPADAPRDAAEALAVATATAFARFFGSMLGPGRPSPAVAVRGVVHLAGPRRRPRSTRRWPPRAGRSPRDAA